MPRRRVAQGDNVRVVYSVISGGETESESGSDATTQVHALIVYFRVFSLLQCLGRLSLPVHPPCHGKMSISLYVVVVVVVVSA